MRSGETVGRAGGSRLRRWLVKHAGDELTLGLLGDMVLLVALCVLIGFVLRVLH